MSRPEGRSKYHVGTSTDCHQPVTAASSWENRGSGEAGIAVTGNGSSSATTCHVMAEAQQAELYEGTKEQDLGNLLSFDL